MAQVRDVYKATATYINPSSVIMLNLLVARRACCPILKCARRPSFSTLKGDWYRTSGLSRRLARESSIVVRSIGLISGSKFEVSPAVHFPSRGFDPLCSFCACINFLCPCDFFLGGKKVGY